MERKYGALISPVDKRDYCVGAYIPVGEQQFPETFRIPNFYNAIFDQGDTAKCVAYSLKWIAEWFEQRENNKLTPLSVDFLFSNRYKEQDSFNLMDFEGTYPRDIIHNFCQDGVCEDSLLKVNLNEDWYTILSKITTNIRVNAKKYKIKHYARIFTDNELMSALMNLGAVTASIPIVNNFKGDYNDLPIINKNDFYGNHMITIVGWTKKNNVYYWECVNSWGRKWGKYNGLFYLPFGYPFNEIWALTDYIAPKEPPKYYRCQVGAYILKSNAEKMSIKLKDKGYQTYIVKIGLLYKVQTGAFNVKFNAYNLRDALVKDGFKDAFVTYY